MPPLRALVAGGFDVALVVTRARQAAGPPGRPQPQPGEGGRHRAGPAGQPRRRRRARHRRRPRRGRGLRRASSSPTCSTPLPMVNLHFSLLPRWRGAAPVERAILAGDQRTGVCLMEVVEGLDTGGVYRRAEVPVGARTADELRAELVTVGARICWSTPSRGASASPSRRRARPPTPRRSAPTTCTSTCPPPPTEVRRGGAGGRRLDDVPWAPPQGVARRRAPDRQYRPRGSGARLVGELRGPSGCGRPWARGRGGWSWSRSSPRARPAPTPAPGGTAPASALASGSARDKAEGGQRGRPPQRPPGTAAGRVTHPRAACRPRRLVRTTSTGATPTSCCPRCSPTGR